MTAEPCTVPSGSMMLDAVAIMAERKISELPVIDRRGRPVGMLDITDVVALFPEARLALPQSKAEVPALAAFPAKTSTRAKGNATTRQVAGQRSLAEVRMKIDARCQKIELILADVDGVLTAGHIIFNNQGIETKQFHIRDGLGIRLWQRAGYKFGLITGRSSHVVKVRAAELGVEIVRQTAEDKLPVAQEILAQLNLDPVSVCYIGDDLPDVPVIRHVGPGRGCGRRVCRSPRRGAPRDGVTRRQRRRARVDRADPQITNGAGTI